MQKITAAFVCTLLLAGTVTLQAQDRLYPNEFPLDRVQLMKGPFQQARDLNIQTLLQYDVDRLLAGYRKEAGLPARAASYPNWAGLDGHVGGHYLSALAINSAATGNVECRRRLAYMLAELKACQEANTKNHPVWGVGYVGAVPNSEAIWSTLQTGDFTAFKTAWVPWYNVHKMYAGLRDAWLYTGNADARNMFLQFCDWGIHITAALTDAQMQSMLNTEQGGMNEVFADAFQMTGDAKYLAAAKRFSHQMLLDPMSHGEDNLDNKHANTQVPKAIGFERIGEVSKDPQYAHAGSFFWETVTTNRTLAFGGNSRREFFPAAASCIDFINDVEGPETCNSYNMLKLTEDLFREEPLAKYADYYERTVFNHILSSQNPETGGYVYFTPTRPRHYRVYSSPNEGMWCCVGSGMENHSKYDQFIYTHVKDSLYLNLFIASELNWKEKGIVIKQETTFPYEEQTKLTITSGKASFRLMVRYPYWVKDGAFQVKVNGKAVAVTTHPSSYVCINRVWQKGDVVQVNLPMHNAIVPMINVPQYVAFMHGPILLAAKTGTEDLEGLAANDSRWGHIAGGSKLPLDKAPIIIEDNTTSLADKLAPVAGKPLTFRFANANIQNPAGGELQPFYTIHDARYEMYWMTLSGKQYRSYHDSLAALEKQNQALDKRTIDFVAPGEQQPEADHAMQKQNSASGNTTDAFWRDARDSGYFSYRLNTGKESGLSLMVRYRGAESGNRQFDIYIDDTKLASENTSDKGNKNEFRDVEYTIPDSIVKGKSFVRVRFQAYKESIAGAVYYLRLLRKS